MSSDTEQIQALTNQAANALQLGDAKTAQEIFERVVATGQADASVWLGLAFASAKLGNNSSTLTAINKSLELDPANLRAIIFKADHLIQTGEPRQAMDVYLHALRLAQQADELPSDIKQGLTRARETCARMDDEYKSFLSDKMKAEGFTPGPNNRRFQQSLDIIFESRDIYYQAPRRYYFPGLPQIQFYERDQFEWVKTIEAATDEIRSELTSVMSSDSKFSPYLQSDETHLDEGNEHLLDSNDWGGLFLWDYGRLVSENAALFPLTIKALEAAPVPVISNQSPMALFSKLTPGTKIPPHNGVLNTRLICHLPIIVPENCGALRVGNEERPWVEGEMLIFDDSIEHEAWNTSEQQRVILLFEVWRPELNEEERQLITTMLAAVKDYYQD